MDVGFIKVSVLILKSKNTLEQLVVHSGDGAHLHSAFACGTLGRQTVLAFASQLLGFFDLYRSVLLFVHQIHQKAEVGECQLLIANVLHRLRWGLGDHGTSLLFPVFELECASWSNPVEIASAHFDGGVERINGGARRGGDRERRIVWNH